MTDNYKTFYGTSGIEYHFFKCDGNTGSFGHRLFKYSDLEIGSIKIRTACECSMNEAIDKKDKEWFEIWNKLRKSFHS